MVASPTTQVSVYIYASVDGSTWPGSSTTNEATIGLDAPVTLPANGNSATALGVIPLTLTTVGVSNIYKSRVFSVLAALGYLPAKYALMIVQNSGAALAATGHSVVIVGIYNA